MSKLKLILCLLSIITLTSPQIVTVASTSSRVAATKCNYTFTISNITNIASVTISFTDWGFFISSPVDSVNTKPYINGQLASIIHANGQSVVSYSPNFGSSQSFTIVLTNMLNPPSTKPYLMNLTFSRSSAPTTLNLTTYLTISAINHQLTLTIRQNNRSVGVSTSTASFDFDSVNYFDNNTLLNLVFDSTKINITFPSSSFYTITQSSGRINISKMSFSMSNTISFSGVAIANPKAALTYAIDVEQFFIETSTKYVYAVANTTVTLLPIAFSTLSIAAPLSMGSLVSLNVSSACSFAQVGSPNETAYTYVTVDSNMDMVNGSDCTAISSTQCKHIKSGSTYSLTNFRPKIGSLNTTITFTAFTYFLSAFYQLCTGQTAVNFTTQKISPYIVSSECNGNSASNFNSINIYSVVESAAEGDTVYMALIKGVVANPLLWRTETVNSTVYLKFTVTNSTFSANGTRQLLKLPLVYSNPNQTSSNTFSDFYLLRGTTKYAIIANSPVAVCGVTTAKQVSFFSSFTTSLTTYQLMNLTLSYSYQIFDYAYNDYILIEFKSLGAAKLYLLGGSLIGKAVNLTVNNVYCAFNILNDTVIKIILSNNITLPTSNTSACTILIYNLVNPPLVDTYWATVTTYDAPTSGMKETFDSPINILIANSLAYSIGNLNLLKQNSLTLTLTGSNRNILSKNMSNPSTLLTILIPTSITCPNFPNSTVSFNWSSALPTPTSFATVNSSSATISLGSCFVSYFIGSLNFSISEKVGTVTSTSTTASVTNTCGDDCFQCASTACTACFNSSFNPKILLYGNACYSNCPSGSYLSGSTCTKCYGSCATCTGGSYNQCSTCITNFQLNSSTCLSICGTGKYSFNGVCVSCHENCNHCISATSCFICKENAVLLGQTCEFSSCTAPCSTCSGAVTTCTSCSSGKYLYLSQCFDSCPTGTYKVGATCSIVSESASFFPVTITGLLCLIIVFLIRRFANSKIGNASRRSLSYSQGTNRQVNYNINVIRLSFVIFAYLQLVAALVILIKSQTYSLPRAATTAVAVGLVIHFASNITFLVGFFRIIYKNRVENNEDDVRLDGQRQFSMKSTSFKVIMTLSILFSFKTFKLLFANLFIDREGLTVTQINENKKQIDESQNNLADINILRVPNSAKRPQQPKVGLGTGRSRHRSQVKKEDDIIPSRKPIRSNSFDDNNNIEINRTDSLRVPNPQDSELRRIQKSFQCFLNGLTLVNLFCASLAVLVGCILVALIPDAIPVVLFHGLDCLVVTAISLGLTVFDTWSFNCLKVDEQSSQMQSKGEVNNTHENLKQEIGLDIKIQPDKKTTRSTKKITSISKPKMSQRSQKFLEKDQFSLEGVRGGIKRECDEETVARNEKLPDLKMFQADFDEQDDNVINQKKTKKFSTKNLQGIKRMGSKRNQSNSHRRSQGGSMFDDLFINFNADEKITNNPNPTTKYASRRSLSPQHSLREGSIKLQDDLEERAPNFTDISDIQDDMPDQVNASIASELINMNFTKQSNPTEKQ